MSHTPIAGKNFAVKAYRLLLYFFYMAFFRHTPEDYRPYALFFPRLRRFLLNQSLAECGRNIRVKSGADVSPNIAIGDYSELGTRCIIQSNVVLGRNVIMGPDVKIYSKNHCYESVDVPIQEQGEIAHKTVIGNDVWIGANVIILPGKRVGNHSILAAGSVITRDVPDYAVVGGNPASVIKYRNRS
jgi:maltose O-acetyltransferase